MLKTALKGLHELEVRPSHLLVQRTSSEKSNSSLLAIRMPGHDPSPQEPSQHRGSGTAVLHILLTGSNSKGSLANSL